MRTYTVDRLSHVYFNSIYFYLQAYGLDFFSIVSSVTVHKNKENELDVKEDDLFLKNTFCEDKYKLKIRITQLNVYNEYLTNFLLQCKFYK